MNFTLQPLFNNVILRRVKQTDRKSAMGIMLPDSVKDEGSWRAEVIATGPGIMMDNGFFRTPPPQLQPGVIVTIPAFPGYQVKIEGEEFMQCKDTEILSIVVDAK